ncbi:hypothetical protein [Neolewinella agarilytica]|uniref:Uncharacterized protein n=1 Tax=Neolewinella agarilytica TaxID=478744 RepID=A0A1H9FB09_9BACT|nr:hypothetical protein [Neolewinella agarilytica]SEQ35110.1 hypothetical protein SAMN05444359_108160 [Neolewinella agarilytica]
MEESKHTQEDKQTAKSWLDYLQQESWQLELLISGFVIFLLIGGWQPLSELEYEAMLLANTSNSFRTVIFVYYVLRTAYFSLLMCLLIHVVLRGLWIAAVGLRSVSGEIDYEALNFKTRFTQRLKRRIGSFDEYINRLERFCSVAFTIAFLILFCFLSLVSWSLVAIVLQRGFLLIVGGEWQGTGILGGAGTMSLVVILFSFIYFIDFISLGWLKKLRWVNRPYYYLYIFMGWVTLARFYRPLYYNLIDHRFGRYLALLLPFVIVLILAGASIEQVKYAYFPVMTGDGKVWQDANNYDDEEGNDFNRIWRTSLKSRYASPSGWIEAFVPYIPVNDDPRLLLIDPTLDVSQYTGTKLNGAFTIGQRSNPDADYERILNAFRKKTRLYINDSLYHHVTPLFHFHNQRKQPGTSYMIPVHDLPPGRHELLIKTRIISGDTLRWSDGRTIYFYK